MQPQGTGVTNPSYFANITAQINTIATPGNPFPSPCAEIQSIVTAASASINAELAAIRAEIATILPMTSIPTSLGGCISWITSFATPMIKQYEAYVAQLSATLSDISALETAISNAASRLTACTITIPPMT